MSFKALTESLDKPFYFGIGGIGDFLLLMATCYDSFDEHTDHDTDVVFVCNNIKAMRKFTALPLFNRVSKFWLYPRQAFYPTPQIWDQIKNNPLCLGTGVTPKRFDYIGDWIECGKSSVFEYYGVDKTPRWASRKPETNLVVIQPFGGADDQTKIKAIPYEELITEIKNYTNTGFNIKLLGSESDVHRYPGIHDYDWVIGFEDSVNTILKCNRFIGSDSWGKTLSGLGGIPTKIYPNQYPRPIEEIFNHPVDPSDYVFLKDWGFTYANGRSF